MRFKRLTSIAAALVLMFIGSLFVTAPAANAASIGGQIYNSSSSVSGVRVAYNWPPSNAEKMANSTIIPRGTSSKAYFTDADGFFVPSGRAIQLWCDGYYYGQYSWGWYKIGDLMSCTAKLI